MSHGGARGGIALAWAIVILAGLFLPSIVAGDSGDSPYRWVRQFGTVNADRASAVAVDGSSVYVAGSMGLHGFVRKFDSRGNAAWNRSFGVSTQDFTNAVAVGVSGVYVAGYTTDSQGGHDVLLQKYDHDGNGGWARQFGCQESGFATAVAVDATGVYIAGYTLGGFSGPTSGGPGAFIRKYDAGGNVLWTWTEGGAIDGVAAIATDASRLYVAGWTVVALPGQPALTGLQDAFLRAYDLGGTLLWTREFGASEADFAGAVAVDASGVYVAGKSGADAFVQRFDPEGNVVWRRQFGNSRNAYAWGVALNRSIVYVAGQTDGAFPEETTVYGNHAFVRAYDANGSAEWTLRFDMSTDNNAAAIDAGPFGVHAAGWTNGAIGNQTSAGGTDAFVACLAERPGAPEDLQAAAGYEQVTLSWRPPPSSGDSPIIGYRIYRGRSPGALSLLADIGDVLTYTDTAAPSGIVFYYQVSARNAAGEGLRSAEASATASPLSTLILLTVSAQAAIAGAGVVGFLIYRRRVRQRIPPASPHPRPPQR